MKTIGIDARFMLRPLRGIPLYVLRLCQNLPRLKREYQFIYFINKGFEHNDDPEKYLSRIEEIEKQNPNVMFVNYDDDAEIKWEQLCLPTLLKEYNVDLLHMPANRICFFPGVKTVVTVHDVMEYLYLKKRYKESINNEKSLKMFLYKTRVTAYAYLTYKFAFKRSAKIITVSSYSADDIEATLNLDKQKITPIHHGLDEEYLGTKPLPHDERKFTLMLGGDSYQKNPATALACWAQVAPDFRKKYPLKIIGFCGAKTSPLIQAVNQHGLSGTVDIHGWVTQEQMVKCFKEAALFLYPSRYEGFGFPLIQAMASGTPIISSNKASIPEVLGDVGYHLDPDDPAGMATAVEKILSSQKEWQHQSDAGYLRSAQFKWVISAQKHLDLYEELL